MSSRPFDLKEIEKRMRGSLDALKRELSGLRTGRASAHLLDPVQVTVYGSQDADQSGGDRHGARAAHDLGAGLGQEQRAGRRQGDPRGQPRPQPDRRRRR